jgi:hypothetical protein
MRRSIVKPPLLFYIFVNYIIDLRCEVGRVKLFLNIKKNVANVSFLVEIIIFLIV